MWFLSDGVNRYDASQFGEGRHISFQEIGVFTTINIGPYSDVSFDGTTSYDVMLAVEGPKD